MDFRLNYSSDPYAECSEWLFQLARHWALWQSPAIGTFPLEYRDPSGPASRDEAEETGEDRAYWEISDILRDTGNQERQIVHTVRVLSRLLALLEESAP